MLDNPLFHALIPLLEGLFFFGVIGALLVIMITFLQDLKYLRPLTPEQEANMPDFPDMEGSDRPA